MKLRINAFLVYIISITLLLITPALGGGRRSQENERPQSPTLKRRGSQPVAEGARPESQRGLKGSNTRTERRIALVIGNSNYEIAPLKNAINDSQDIAQALRGIGFEVTYQENITKDEMKRAIKSFGDNIRNGGIGLFYFAGHGLQVKGLNYLVPVDANLSSEEEVEYECIEVGSLIAQMVAASNEMNIIILDACRNNPFARSFRSISRGLAPINAPRDVLIAYATGPDSVASDGNGRNGIYTQELLKNMRLPDLAVEEVFKRVRISVLNLTQGKQIPWESSSLTKSFYFTGSKGYDAAAQNEPQPKPLNNPDVAPPRPKPQGQAVKENFFTFELQECKKSGSTVSCEFLITNNDKDRYLGITDYDTAMFDNLGNESKSNSISIAGKTGRYGTETMLVMGIPTRSGIRFEGVSTEATRISLLTINCYSAEHAGGIGTDKFKIQLRNVPLTR